MQDIPRTSIRELAHIIKRYEVPRFAFFLGAGASRQSGIITASEMIRHFKEQIIAQSCPDALKKDEEKAKWLSEQDWYQAEGTEYCKCFERFEPKEIGRQRYIESIIEKREPSFGYVVLANLIARGHVNTIITTNFDDLVYSACTTFTGIRPIVYAYGIMASEMRLTAHRSKILKLHGDYLYSALKNTGSELTAQDPNMARQFRQMLSEYGLIVVGYGGGDKSIMDILSDISPSNDLYWCVRRGDKINEDVEKLLREKSGFIVEIEGFDEMMNEVRRVVDFDVKAMLGSIEERRNQIIKYLEKFEPQYSADILGNIVDAAKEPETKASEDKTISALDYALRALKAQKAKDFSTAEELYGKAIELDPNYIAAYNNLGNVLKDLKRYDEAEVAYRRAIKLDPSYSAAYNNLGLALRNLKRYDGAEAAHRRAIELKPTNSAAYNNLGLTLRELKRYEEAEAAHRRAIELDPSNLVAYSNLGNVLRDLKRHDEAEATYRKAIELDPSDSFAYNNLGNLLKDLKRYDEAEATYRKAIELDPSDANVYNNLGLTLRDLDRYDEAEVAYRKAIELDPSYYFAYSNLGIVHRDLKRYDEAEVAYRKAMEINPKSPHPLLGLASIHKKLGHETKSSQYAAQARELFEPDDWYNLACLESVCGNTDAAIENLRRAAEQNKLNREWARRDPDFEWIRDDPRFKEIVGEEGA